MGGPAGNGRTAPPPSLPETAGRVGRGVRILPGVGGGHATLLLVYAATLLVAVLLSERAERTVLSTAVLFLAVGIATGSLRGPARPAVVRSLAEVALVAVLFVDALRLSLSDLRGAWALPGRALLLGFPLTLGGTAVLARVLVGLPWPEAVVAGAALAPTDPVFAAAIVGREEVPARLRQLLNVESGVNDGLALPFLLAAVAWAGHTRLHPPALAAELAGGVALGAAVPWIAVRLERTSFLGASREYRRVGVLAVGMLVFALCAASGANPYLASFAAGTSLATVAPRAQAAFEPIASVGGEALKLGALLVFGTMLRPELLGRVGLGGWAFAALALVAVRPAALALALVGTPLTPRERLVAGWFGPKGFASVVYGLFVAASGLPRGEEVFGVIAATTALSIVLHASTDVPVARWFRTTPVAPPGDRAHVSG